MGKHTDATFMGKQIILSAIVSINKSLKNRKLNARTFFFMLKVKQLRFIDHKLKAIFEI